MKANINLKKINWRSIALIIAALIIGIAGGTGLGITISPEGDIVVETLQEIELANEQILALINTEDGEVESINVPTVESVDSLQVTDGCGEDEECGKGKYIYAPTESANAFKEYTIARCWDTDGYYGAQCWDLGDLFWQNYAGRNLSTCGTGAAKGTINDGCWQKNAGSDFTMIWDATQIQAGDWVVFTNGEYGHIGMALGSYNNGYVTLLGQNQGGASCAGGGSVANIINISLKNFGGAFRPNAYIVVEPEAPEEPVVVDDKIEYTYKKGDTFGQVVTNLGLKTSAGLWGSNGDVAYYTEQLHAQGIYGNIPIGTTIKLTRRI